MTPRILYYCYDSNTPAGGEKECYQHVNALTRCGFEAYALHHTPGFRFTWFENTTPILYWRDILPGDVRNIFVLPENLGLAMKSIRGRKVIFNKGIYSGFKSLGLSPEGPSTYLDDDVVAILSMSHHNRDYLEFAYPSKPVFTVMPDIRPNLFTHRPLTSRRPWIAYAAKASPHGRTLFQILNGRSEAGLNEMKLFKWVPIITLHERQVVAVLQNALFFVFLSVDEGLPRLPIEAMACGCLVCAYGSGPLLEILPRPYQFEYGDLLGMARHIERIANAFPDGLAEFDQISAQARIIASSYCAEAQERSVLAAWKEILAGA